MILTCPECATSYFVDDGRVPPEGRVVKCSSCSARWRATPQAEPEPEPNVAPAPHPEVTAQRMEPPAQAAANSIGDLDIVTPPAREAKPKAVATKKSRAGVVAILLGLAASLVLAVDGQTAPLDESGATWAFTSPKPASAMITVTDSTGQTAFSGNFTLQAGELAFNWDGKGNNGQQWPKGNYKMTISAKDASGVAVAVKTEVEGPVESVDLSKDPPTLSIGGQNFTIDKVKRVIRPRA